MKTRDKLALIFWRGWLQLLQISNQKNLNDKNNVGVVFIKFYHKHELLAFNKSNELDAFLRILSWLVELLNTNI